MKRRKAWRMSSAMTITMSSAHSPSFQSLHLRHSSFLFYKLSVTSPTSQLILQPFFRFSYVTGFSLTSPGEPPMFGHHYHPSSFHYGRQWPEMLTRPKTSNIHTYIYIHGFISLPKEVILRIFTLWKKFIDHGWARTREPRIQRQVW